MFVQQISVFIENRKGHLSEFTRLLADNGLDLIALSIADTENFGILRVIVNDTPRALEVIRNAGYAANCNDVLAVAVPDSPGGLAGVLQTLYEEDISVEYLYSFVRNIMKSAVIIFRVKDLQRAQTVFASKGVRMLTPDEVRGL